MKGTQFICLGLSELAGWNIISDDLKVINMNITQNQASMPTGNMGFQQYFPGKVSSKVDITVRFGKEYDGHVMMSGNKQDLSLFMFDNCGSSGKCIKFYNCFISGYQYIMEPRYIDVELTVVFDSYGNVDDQYEQPIEEKLRRLGF